MTTIKRFVFILFFVSVCIAFTLVYAQEGRQTSDAQDAPIVIRVDPQQQQERRGPDAAAPVLRRDDQGRGVQPPVEGEGEEGPLPEGMPVIELY